MAINWQSYLDANPDLQDHYYNAIQPSTGESLESWASKHYINNGRAEGRQVPGATDADINALLSNGTTSTTAPVDTGIGSLVTGANGVHTDSVTAALQNGVNQAGGTGNNTNQVQGSDQSGSYSSTGNQTQTTQGNENVRGTTTSDTTGTQRGTTTTSDTTTGTTSGTTNDTTTVNDTLGLGALLQSQFGGAQASDATRQAELTRIATQGGAGLQSQLDQGIRQAMSGPQMSGAGDSARARASGYAAAELGRKDLDARLGALQQLSGPTASGNLVTQGTPLLGSTRTGTSSGTNTSSTVGTQIQDLVNTNHGVSNTTQDTTSAGSSVDSSNQAGTATGSNVSIATGQTPQQSSSSGGSCFVASALASLKLIGPRGIRKAVRYKLDRYKYMPIGYAIYGPWLARQTLKHSWVRRLMLPVVRSILYEELRLAGKARCLVLSAWTMHLVFHYGSAGLGFVVSQFGAKFETKDTDIRNLLIQHNLYFQ